MFTKSQLVAAAVLAASASSVIATPIYNDVEARGYSSDALIELKRRAILDYIQELEARDPTEGASSANRLSAARPPPHRVTHHVAPALSGEGSTAHQASLSGHRVHPHHVTSGDRQTTTHRQNTQQHHLSSHGRKTDGQRTEQHHHVHEQHSTEHKHSEHKHALVKESGHHAHSGSLSANSAASASSKGSGPGAKTINKRSIFEYLVGRAPSGNTPAAAATQSTPASTKVSNAASSHKDHKQSENHQSQSQHQNQHQNQHQQHSSNLQAGTHKTVTGDHHQSVHKEAEGKARPSHSSHLSSTGHRHNSETHDHTTGHGQRLLSQQGSHRGRTQRHRDERTSNGRVNGHREGRREGHKDENSHHRLSSSRLSSSETHSERVKTNDAHTHAHAHAHAQGQVHRSGSNSPASHAPSQSHSQSQNRVASHASPALHDQQQKQIMKAREIEELVELLARELDLYDELD